jgi:mono/diheme cytochrome c family protein
MISGFPGTLLRVVTGFSLACLAVQAWADDPPQPAPQAATQTFIQLLDQLQNDPGAREKVRQTIQQRIDELKAGSAPIVQQASQALAEANNRANALKQRVDDLAKQLETARAEFEQLQKQIPELAKQLDAVQAQQHQSASNLPLYERTLQLIDALAPVAVVAAQADATTVPATPATAALSEEQKVFFEKGVKSVLAENCFGCHGTEKQKSELRLDSLEAMLKGGKRGPAIKPGDAGGSLIIQAITQAGELKMPPDKQLDASTLGILVKWVEMGAPWPQQAAETQTAVAPAPQTKTEPAPKLPEPSPDPHADVRPASNTAGHVNFAKDIRPILANTCFACHGPDDKARKAGLRLDIEENALAALKDGGHPIVPGDRNKSQMYVRTASQNPDEIMPPPDFGKTLKPEQVELLGKWIDEGGKYEKHWSFEPAKEYAAPNVSKPEWVRNPIDRFILARLDQEKLNVSPEADRHTLIRRVSFDTTGLPPTRDEVQNYVNDQSPDAYEKMVDHFLASPRYGEQMARYWLDLARYADTNGYHIDNERYMWRWRDWLIDSFNKNMPYDEFTIEQLAGDLLPNPSLDQVIATGFNRNHMITFEGGVIPEEYRVQYVMDRVNTTSTVWMALTLGCCQCHDHKFDPFTARDFYSMSAFFDSIPEEGIDGREGNALPRIKAPLPEQAKLQEELAGQINAMTASMQRPLPEIDQAQAQWESDYIRSLASRWSILDPTTMKSAGGATLTKRGDGAILVSGENPEKDTYEFVATTPAHGITAIRLEALTDPSLPNNGVSRATDSNFYLSEFEAEAASATQPELVQKVKFTLANADFSQPDTLPQQAIDGNAETAWAVEGNKRRENRIAVFMPDHPIGFADGTRITIRMRHESKHKQRTLGCFRISVTSGQDMAPGTYGQWYVSGPYVATDGKTAFETAYDPEKKVDLKAVDATQRAVWIPRLDFADGVETQLIGDVAATYVYRVINVATDRNAVFKFGANDALKVWLNGQVVLEKGLPRSFKLDEDSVNLALKKGENHLLLKVVNFGNAYSYSFRRAEESVGETPLDIEPILALSADKRTEQQVTRLRAFYRSKHWPEWQSLDAQLATLNTKQAELDKAIPTAMVMKEMEAPRETFILTRGQYDQHGEKVTAATPAALSAFPTTEKPNRLGLARWLVDPNHPLTSRVAVNRLWQYHFGTGLVKTTEDFGVQGELPSHPELLDWLAIEFVRSQWDIKHMHRLILTSSTFRQSSKATPELLDRDPENRLLARSPRYRLDAEEVRDTALALSGLLVPKVGGPSVKPYQPKGIWEEVSYGGKDFTGQVFEQDHGEALYRRSMYTFWKRQAPPPSMQLFDAPNREVCTARRARTNTPLQALVTMNDTQFVEASRFMAERVMKEGGPDPTSRATYAFELAAARKPTQDELNVILDVLNQQLHDYKNNPAAAKELVSVGEGKRDESLEVSEHAAWTMVANLILNLDETLTKN